VLCVGYRENDSPFIIIKSGCAMSAILKFIMVGLLLSFVIEAFVLIVLAGVLEVVLIRRRKKMWNDIIKNDQEIREGLERLKKKINERAKEIR